jgi:hypothetical protein
MAKVSECCGAYSEYAGDIDICPDCLEHCEFVDDEDEDENLLEQAEKAEFFKTFERTGTYPM